MALYVGIVAAVFATSVMSGILGMAGGMILMAILVVTMGVSSAMMLHGAVQATANGSRAWFLRRYIRWQLLPRYIFGAVLATALFGVLAFVPPAGLVLVLVGIFPWLARFSKYFKGLDITHPPTTVICGFVVTVTQLMAGASGPLLDVFYVNTPLNRQAIVANKAITQTLGHILKIIYYGVIVALATPTPIWLYSAAIATAIAGTSVGTRLLMQWNDHDFQRVSRVIILSIASLCIVQGLWDLVTLD